MLSMGERFRQLLTQDKPLQIPGVINSYCALLAEKAQFQALYLSGAGVANAAFGLPDLGMTTLTEVVEEARRITTRVQLPLLVDGDTGWGDALNIERAVHLFIEAGVAAVHFEDQVWPKRCGHRTGKKLISIEEMVAKIEAAVAAKTDPHFVMNDPHFVIIARTDALGVEGLRESLKRAKAYAKAGADMIFAEAVTELSEYRQFVEAVDIPILANITEFGQTPLFSLDELKSVGVRAVLYPLTAFRVMAKAALDTYGTIQREGSQKNKLQEMQTREELYQILNYHAYESKINRE